MITADAQEIPYVDKVFDLVVSSLTYQWIDDIESAFREVARVTASNGVFAFTVLGTNTFQELRESYNKGICAKGAFPPLHTFPTKDTISFWLQHTGFGKRKIDAVTVKKKYPDVQTFLKTLKYIGAQNAQLHFSAKGIGKKRPLLSVIDFYQNNFSNEFGIYATYEIYFGIAVRKG